MNLQRGFTETPEVLAILTPRLKRQDGDLRDFDGLTGEEALKLIDLGAADGFDRQNDSPTYHELATAAAKYPNIALFGYWVTSQREDERITIDGIKGTVDTEAFYNVFAKYLECADERTVKVDTNAKQVFFRFWWD